MWIKFFFSLLATILESPDLFNPYGWFYIYKDKKIYSYRNIYELLAALNQKISNETISKIINSFNKIYPSKIFFTRDQAKFFNKVHKQSIFSFREGESFKRQML